MKRISLIAVSALLPLFLSQCKEADGPADVTAERTADVTFARDTFVSLAKGETTVRNNIDWATLRALGQNNGAAYVQFTSELEKDQFEQAFVTQFASAFREAGGTPDDYTNWRVTHHDEIKSEIAADSPGGTLVLTVTERDGVEKVSGIDMIK